MTDKKKPSLKDLIRASSKREVSTSLGPLYIRHLVYKDYKTIVESGAFEEANEREIGLQAIRATTSTLQDPGGWDGLNDEVFSMLTTSDLDALATVALEEAEYPATEDLIAGLGRGVLDQYADLDQASKKIFDQFRNSLSFLQPSTLESLTASVTAIDQSNQKWKSLVSNIYRDPSVAHVANGMESLKSPYQDRPPYTKSEIILPKLDFSNTNDARAARASEKAVDVLNQLAAHMGEVQAHTASMYSTLVLEAIPQWMAQQESNKEQSELSLRSAASSLRWTKWAVITSIITSIGIAAYQQQSGYVDADTTLRQANERQAYWEKQSATQQALLSTQIQATQNLQAELKSLNSLLGKSLTSNAPATKLTNSKTSKKQSQR
ncbi:hypothetical protein [Pseudomonas baltica]|uniref:hypothetical protein n=1 Tax=Pseudomonas baltica TaxID=2762576 RepID=UPI00289DE292|nr:hypothetical protein [Pseudomonas baltica]